MHEAWQTASILLVEDSPSLAAVYTDYLKTEHYHLVSVETGEEALAELQNSDPDIMLLDLKLPGISGMEVLQKVYEQKHTCAVIIITAHGSVDLAMEAMRYGATDFIAKPFDAGRLRVTISNTLEKRRLGQMVNRYEKTFERKQFHRFIGNSLPMQTLFRIIENAAPSKATVFVTGESGTGKELCAEAIHAESPRHNKRFLALNCAAIPKDLIESEIFGHVKGAFTGATSQKDGAATNADGGTLFLDEICEMDLNLQSKLLRFIQTGRFQRVGGSREEQVDIRIVCATNRAPLAEVEAGRFREDLYYRLNVIPIELPALRERGLDITLIAENFLKRMAVEENKQFQSFSADVEELLLNHQWPGNVRELENIIRNIVVLNDGEQARMDMLPATLTNVVHSKPTQFADHTLQSVASNGTLNTIENSLSHSTAFEIRPLWLEEKEIIERAIRLCDGNIPKAAAHLGISASTIYRKKASWNKVDQMA